jgi:hypothetical protein
LRLTPKLVLSGFSQLGCPVDAGIGGTLTYAVPLRASTWLVFGGGIYGVPAQVPLFGGTRLRPEPPVEAAGKVDFDWSTRGGRTYSVGVESLGGVRQGITFGGGF